jgi:CDP-paratose 2-epimerase
VANLDRLRAKHGQGSFRFIHAGVDQFPALLEAAEGVDRLYHLAGQVAVTASVADPMRDFTDNAVGTVHALEAARRVGNKPIFIYSSTNKVYGSLEDVELEEEVSRYRYREFPKGIPETHPVDFHSPYGCSKGCGDQYARDYFRIYGLRTLIFRQSCIYGHGQFGLEGQGWMSWLIMASRWGWPITICGNGKQVRDVLYIDDLLDAYEAGVDNIHHAAGQVFNIGGGPGNTLSIWKEYGPMIERLLGRHVPVSFSDWRPGDQKVYISDIRKAGRMLGWAPRVSVEQGIPALHEWIAGHEEQIMKAVLAAPTGST